MIDANPRTEVIVPLGLEHLINVNTEYQKIICLSSGCGYAKELSTKQWVRHLQGHKVPRDIAVGASSFIKGLGWERSLSLKEVVPPHGLAPQPSIEVIDGVRRTYCRVFISTNTTEVKMHWELAGHGASDGCLVESKYSRGPGTITNSATQRVCIGRLMKGRKDPGRIEEGTSLLMDFRWDTPIRT